MAVGAGTWRPGRLDMLGWEIYSTYTSYAVLLVMYLRTIPLSIDLNPSQMGMEEKSANSGQSRSCNHNHDNVLLINYSRNAFAI